MAKNQMGKGRGEDRAVEKKTVELCKLAFGKCKEKGEVIEEVKRIRFVNSKFLKETRS